MDALIAASEAQELARSLGYDSNPLMAEVRFNAAPHRGAFPLPADIGVITDVGSFDAWLSKYRKAFVGKRGPVLALVPGGARSLREILWRAQPKRGEYVAFLRRRRGPDRPRRRNDVWDTGLEPRCAFWELTSRAGEPRRKLDGTQQLRLRYVRRLGKGAGGMALEVEELTVTPAQHIVVKLAIAGELSVSERKLGALLNKQMLLDRRSPNFVANLFELVCVGLPPPEGAWGQEVRDFMNTTVREAMTRWQRGTPLPQISYVASELADLGAVIKFANENRLGVDQIRSFTFQFLYGLAALHEVGILHRDIQNQNVVLSTYRGGKRGWKPFLFSTRSRVRGGETRTTHYDPHLLLLPRAKKSRMHGPLPKLRFTVKIIDFGFSLRLTPQNPLRIFVDFKMGVLTFNPPEFFFIDRRPVEIDPKLLQAKRGLAVPYTKASDLWAAGMVIATVALGGAHLFIEPGPDPPGWPAGRIRWDFPAPQAVVTQMTNVFSQSPAMSAFMVNNPQLINESIHYMWNMVEGLGLPNNEIWPGIEDSRLWQVIHKYRGELQWGRNGGWVKVHPSVKRSMEPAGVRMLLDLMHWNPVRRGSAFRAINDRSYFATIRQAGDLLARRGGKLSRWSFDQGWFQRRRGPARKKGGRRGRVQLIGERVKQVLMQRYKDATENILETQGHANELGSFAAATNIAGGVP